MSRRCGKGGWVVRYGEWIELYDEEGNFLSSFRARGDMCRDQLTRYVTMYLGIETTTYTVKRIPNK